MPRLLITVPKNMDKVLKDEARKTNAPVAALVREAIYEWALKRGIEIEDTISWGGLRWEGPHRSTEDSEGQSSGITTECAA